MGRLDPIWNGFRKVGGFFLRIVRGLFGSVSYSPPGWARFLYGKLAQGAGWVRLHPGRAGLVVVMLLALGGGAYLGNRWYQGRPKPEQLEALLSAPSSTRLEENAKPDPLRIVFNKSAVPIEKAKKPVEQGVTIEPAVPGTWKWETDKALVFTPKEDWPVGEKFVVTLAKKGLVRDDITLKSYELSFESAPFTASISHTEFYQDPQDQSLKKVVATVTFSHPVEAQALERALVLELRTKKDGQERSQPYRYQLTFDKLRGNAFVHSDPIQIPERNSEMYIRVAPGLRSLRGGKGLKTEVTEKVNIPGLYDFLRMKEAQLTLVNNAQYEPEQVLLLEANTGVTEQEMRNAVSAYLLPLRPLKDPNPGSKDAHYWIASEITKEVLAAAQPLKLEQIANEKDYATLHSFRYQADVGRSIYVVVKRGMRSFGGYLLDHPYDTVQRVPEYPKELKIMQSGALLSLSGEKKVSVYTRDVEALRVEIGRVLPGQLHHLVSQNNGSFQSPEFYNYRFSAENITESFTNVIKMPKVAPGKPQYTAVDLGDYVEGKGEDRRGLFFLKVESYDPERKTSTGKSDSRLVLLTDLGMLVKDNGDGSHEVFVQSLASGEPVKGAKVELLGKNGLPVMNDATDSEGHVSLPTFKNLHREKSPLLYLVRKGNDMSFLPYDRMDRYLNLSRFPIEGVRDQDKPNGLSAFLFSDRGIYRPGDEIRVGLIVKPRDWSQSLASVPLEWTVEDARGVTVKREKLRLSESGFEELRHTTLDGSPTGSWNVNVYIVKDGRASSLLGSTTVRVQEFQPDRLKIVARLSADSVEGWVSPNALKARVSLQNLFGTPATGRRVRAVLELSPTFPSFSKFRDYRFADPMRAKESHTDNLPDGETNDLGEAEFDLNLSRFAAATYRLRFLANGYEAEGGRGVAAETQVTVSPMPYLVGWKADGDLHYVSKDSQRSVQLIAVGPQAQKVTAAGVRAVLVERKYLSVLTKQWNGTYKYDSVRKEVVLGDKKLDIPEAGLKYALATDKPGDYAIILKNDKSQELNRVEWRVAGTANLTRSLEKNAELQLVLKNPDVAPGEELELQIKAPYTGAGLITIERDKVRSYQWFKTTTTASIQKIKVPEDLEGNGFVNVSFIRGIDSNEVFMSPLSYGVAAFSISRARRTAKVSVTTQDLLKPGENLKIKYSTDRPAKIVLFAVDEGILQVANYKTPDPLAYFFQKRALEVKTAQILDLILPEYSRIMASAPGGDGEEGGLRNLNPFKRRRDKPVAYWSGIIDAGPKEREVTYTIPDYFNGKLRVMAVAVAPDAVGVFHKNALVRGDFVLSPNVPTFAAPGDEFEVSVTVANNVVGSGKNAQVSLELKTSKHVEVIGPAQVTLGINELRETTARFTLRATQTLGSANLSFVAKLGNKSGRYAVDLSVRPPVPLLVTTNVGHLKDGQVPVAVPRKLYADYRVLMATVSSLPLGIASGLAQYLKEYPHGCTEQTVSQGMPALALRNRAELGYTPQTADPSIAKVIDALRSRQGESGAFAQWQNPNQTSDFSSVYATHFLVEAKERGLAVPPDLLKRALEYTTELASRETENLEGERLRAYAVYVLTRSGVVTSQYLTSVQKSVEGSYEAKWKNDVLAAYLAASYKLLKQERKAQQLAKELKLGVLSEADADYANYYDPLIRDSVVLYILARHFPDRLAKLDGDVMLGLVGMVGKGSYNTLSSAYTILALDALAQVAGEQPAGQLSITELLDNGQKRPLVLPAGLVPTTKFSPDISKLLIGSSGPLRAFYQTTQSGYDLSLPTQVIKQKLEVFREFKTTDGKDLQQVKLGDEVLVHLRLRAIQKDASYSNLAIIDLLPGGFEVVVRPPQSAEHEEEEKDNARDKAETGESDEGGDHGEGEGGEGGEGSHDSDSDSASAGASLPIAVEDKTTWRPIYGDVREDRVVLYGTVTDDLKEFVYTIKATNVGSYVVPPLQGEGMYDRSILARSLGGKIVVVK